MYVVKSSAWCITELPPLLTTQYHLDLEYEKQMQS